MITMIFTYNCWRMINFYSLPLDKPETVKILEEMG